jgi:hypothetical protein
MKISRQSVSRYLVVSLAVFSAPIAWGCSPIKSIGVVFARNSAEVPADQVLKLAHWTSMLRVKYPNREAIFMTTQAAFGENDASELGVRRATNVAKVLAEDLQFDVQRIKLPATGYVATKPAPEGSDLVKRVDVEFLPACPHECPCQFGDPLYQPRTPQR